MTQHYSNPKRESEPHALPDVETFYVGTVPYYRMQLACFACRWNADERHVSDYRMQLDHSAHVGWYWQACFPGCLPDGEPNGPFATEAETVADAQADAWQDDESLDDDEQEPQPDDDDYYLSADERSIYSNGKLIVGPVPADSVPCPQDAVLAELRLYMDRTQFWPNVWKVSDHGNVSLLTVPARVRYVQCAACSTESVYHRAMADGWTETAEGWADEFGPVNSYTCEECQQRDDD